MFGCISAGSWTTICQIMTNACAPAWGPVENGAGSAGCNGCSAGKPISLATGNTYIDQADVRVPGLGGGLTLSRTWNSLWPSTQTASQIGLFGPNWRSTYEERVFVGSDNYVKYARSDGNFWSFGYSTGGAWGVAAPAKTSATLTQDGTYWTLTFQNGERRVFSFTSGSLLAIIDRNGNTTQLSYDATNRLTTVTDPASRHLYFGYANNTSRLVTSLTSDFGLSLSYTYDTQGRLIKVTKPDQTTVSFQYDSNSFISAVLDNDGKVLESHTYDSSGRGLTSSRAGGVEALTLSYQ
jgi:YD repeat-containing protein